MMTMVYEGDPVLRCKLRGITGLISLDMRAALVLETDEGRRSMAMPAIPIALLRHGEGLSNRHELGRYLASGDGLGVSRLIGRGPSERTSHKVRRMRAERLGLNLMEHPLKYFDEAVRAITDFVLDDAYPMTPLAIAREAPGSNDMLLSDGRSHWGGYHEYKAAYESIAEFGWTQWILVGITEHQPFEARGTVYDGLWSWDRHLVSMNVPHGTMVLKKLRVSWMYGGYWWDDDSWYGLRPDDVHAAGIGILDMCHRAIRFLTGKDVIASRAVRIDGILL